MFNWKKKGHIYAPTEKNKWLKEFAQNPNALELSDRIRIYYSGRRKSETDGMYVSYISFVDVEKEDPSKIIYVHDKPSVNLGEEGDFDQFGTMPGSLIATDKGEIWLYYVGWSRSEKASAPYRWANGLAISKDDGITFNKVGNGPIISSTYNEPCLHACPRVFRFNKKWLMWYAAGLEWLDHDGRPNPIYVIMSGTSEDGMNWKLSDQQTLPSVSNKECQSGASVFEYKGKYHMFFSYRHVVDSKNSNKTYRIGYASSKDMVRWERDDKKAGLDVSESGWDSEAVCYPHVVKIGGKIYIFYSGNYYGKAGFGYAVLDE